MIETKYKPAEELRRSLAVANRVAVLSCGACANLCDTGGVRGAHFLKQLFEGWGKEVVIARTIVACCPEPIMRQALKPMRRMAGIDALVVISCAAGVKSAFLCNPGFPIIAACDTIGAAPIASDGPSLDELVAHTPCVSCGHCVISYTAGICPLAGCASHSVYGPCKKAPLEGTQCALDPQRECIWREIERRGADLEALKELEQMHRAGQECLPSLAARTSSSRLRKYAGYVGASLPGRLMETAHWIR